MTVLIVAVIGLEGCHSFYIIQKLWHFITEMYKTNLEHLGNNKEINEVKL